MKNYKIQQNNHETLTKTEKGFLDNPKNYQFSRLSKSHELYEIRKSYRSIKSEYLEISDSSDLKLRPIGAGSPCPTHTLSKLIDILL